MKGILGVFFAGRVALWNDNIFNDLLFQRFVDIEINWII